jgi:hypothetical protein
MTASGSRSRAWCGSHIHGYVGEPKYKGAELEAMANTSASNPANNAATNTSVGQTDPAAKPSPVRQRLEPPNN